MRRLCFLLAVCLCAAVPAHADVTLSKLFSSHMVLQRDVPIHLWGLADAGEQVEVSLDAAHGSVKADSIGRWSVYLPAHAAGGPYTLTVRATNRVEFDDVMMGDLWVASGQSNMELPLKGYDAKTQVDNGPEEIAKANYPNIRLFLIKHDNTDYPLQDFKAVDGWSQCSPATAGEFSAVAYFFARALQQKEHVAIGLIEAGWGGTPAEAWMSLDTLSNDANLRPVFSQRAAWMDDEVTAQQTNHADTKARAEGKNPPHRPWRADPYSWRPAGLYNALIAPITPLTIRGVIWYQGEANSAQQIAPFYYELFPALIQDWRARWNQPDLPFLFAQLSAYSAYPTDQWGVIRDAQRHALYLANTGMAVTLDIGNGHSVHPGNKQSVGERLSLLARQIVYKEDLVASGPLFRLAYPEGHAMHVWFDNAAGLKANGKPGAFEVAGEDGVFAPATATIEGDTVMASSDAVPEPRYVRYAWANFPSADHPANLYNGAGLPASTFTSAPLQ
ncbi:MAG TPA: sialate O-acetylesterase [Acidobacteriaceae bacterium]|nr:sialate O-acetylesterase [Acidobacteriaceae bacterium]